jgi:hypothetical protein
MVDKPEPPLYNKIGADCMEYLECIAVQIETVEKGLRNANYRGSAFGGNANSRE